MFKIGNSRKNKINNFKDLLPDIINDFDIEKDLFIENIKEIWQIIVSQALADHSIPEKLIKGKLIIAVDHSIFANEISLMKNMIIDKINEKVSSKRITDLKCEIKKLNW